MDIFAQIETAVHNEYHNGELPVNLLKPLQQVTDNPQQFAEKHDVLSSLLHQLHAFEPYCDCGCFAEGFNAKDISKTLQKLGIETTE